MTFSKSILLAVAASVALAGCSGGSSPDPKVVEQFRKQFKASCSLGYMGKGLSSDQKDSVCNCASDEILKTTDLGAKGDGFRRVSVPEEKLRPVLTACEAKAGVTLRTGGPSPAVTPIGPAPTNSSAPNGFAEGAQRKFSEKFMEGCVSSAVAKGATDAQIRPVCQCALDGLTEKYGLMRLLTLSKEEAMPVLQQCAKDHGLRPR